MRKRSWRLENATLDEDGRTVRLATPTRTLTVWIDDAISDGSIDRIYTPLLPFADGSAAAVYSGYLTLEPAHGRTTFQLEGVIAARGADASPAAIFAVPFEGAPHSYLVVGRPLVIAAGRHRFIVDRDVPSDLLAEIRATLDQVEGDFSPLRTENVATTVLATRSGRREGPPTWRGDTLGHAVRLNFLGEGWDRASAALRLETRRFVIHELFHLVNGDVVRVGAFGDGKTSLLEGTAEAASWDALRRHGVIDDAAYGDAFEDGVARCNSAAGDTLAAKERESSRTAPYACGQALAQLMAAAGRIEGGNDLLGAWRTLLRGPGTNRSALGWADLMAAHRATPGSRSADGTYSSRRKTTRDESWLVLASLGNSSIGWDAALSKLTELGLLKTVTPGESQKPERALFHAAAAVNSVLDQHCRGVRGFTRFGGVFELDTRPESCTGLTDKFRLVAIEGYELASDGWAAAEKQRVACSQTGHVTWRDEGGQSLTVECRELPPLPVRYRLAR